MGEEQAEIVLHEVGQKKHKFEVRKPGDYAAIAFARDGQL